MQKLTLSPSALPYAEKCPGFNSAERSTVRAERGTRLHEAVETGADLATTEYDESLVEYARGERERIRGEWSAGSVSFAEYTEHHLAPPSHLRLPLAADRGRVDYLAVDTLRNRALIFDYKFTMATHDAKSDLQGIAYAILAAETFFPKRDDVQVTVVFIDAENRSTSQATFTVTPAFRGSARRRIEAVHTRRQVFDGGVTDIATPGKHCRFCSRLGTCRAASTWIFPLVREITDGKVAEETPLPYKLRVRALLRDYADALTGVAKEKIIEGEIIPGFELVAADGRDKVGTMDKFVAAAIAYFQMRDAFDQKACDLVVKLREELAKISKPTKGAVMKLLGKTFGKENVPHLMRHLLATEAIVPGDPYEELQDKTETMSTEKEETA